MRVVEEGECCSDCACVIANGVESADDEATQARIEAYRPGRRGQYLVNACGEDCDEAFSSRPCECCGSPLAGARHRFARLA